MAEHDLGSGFSYSTFTEDGVEGTTGVIVTGPCGSNCHYKKGESGGEPGRCGGGVYFENSRFAERAGRARWKVEQEEPLTLSPSIVCACGDQHGFIREGRWQAA